MSSADHHDTVAAVDEFLRVERCGSGSRDAAEHVPDTGTAVIGAPPGHRIRLPGREVRVEADVLTTLRRAGKPYELTAGALVRSSMVTTGAITKRIDRMVDKGLVSRVPSTADRRTVLIRLSSRGKQILDDLFADHIANYERLLAALDRGQSEQLAGTLRILLCAMGDTSLT